MQDLNDKITGGSLSAAEWNEIPTEIQNIITALGLALSGADLNQLGKGIAGYVGAGNFYAETGLADAYVANAIGGKQGPPNLGADADGLLVRFVPGNNNTGASTINVQGIGVKAITRESGAALSGGELITTMDAWVRWDFAADSFVILDFNVPGSLEVPRGYIDGLILSNDADADHDILFGPGVCRDSLNVATMALGGTGITKQIDIAGGWIEGDNNAGLPSILDPVAANLWLHCFILRNPSNGNVDAGFDSSIIAANLLAESTGFTQFLRVGAVKTDGTTPGNILQFVQHGNKFVWVISVQDINVTNPGTGDVSRILASVPTGLAVLADIAYYVRRPDSASLTHYRIGQGGETLEAASSSNTMLGTGGDTGINSIALLVLTDTVQTIKTRQSGSNASAEVKIETLGWVDPRGSDL